MVEVSRLSLLKIVELVLICICIGIHFDSYNLEAGVGMLVTGTFVGYLIIVLGGGAGHLLKKQSHKYMELFYTVLGAVLFITSGVVLISKFSDFLRGSYRSKMLAKGSIAIINGAVMVVDAVLTYRGG